MRKLAWIILLLCVFVVGCIPTTQEQPKYRVGCKLTFRGSDGVVQTIEPLVPAFFPAFPKETSSMHPQLGKYGSRRYYFLIFMNSELPNIIMSFVADVTKPIIYGVILLEQEKGKYYIYNKKKIPIPTTKQSFINYMSQRKV